MNYKLGNSKRIHDKGETAPLVCPNCNCEVQLGVFTNLDTRLVVKPSVIDVNNIYFLVCPSCAAIYTVDEELTHGHKKKNLLEISSDDLKELKEYSAKN